MSDYKMPEVKIGDRVFFRAHDGAEPVMSFVTQASSRTITLWSVVPGYGGIEKTSVHHKDDPGFADFPAWKETGMWEAFPEDSRLAILSERVSMLEKKIAAIAPKKG